MAFDLLKIEVLTNFLYPGMILKGDGFAENGEKVIKKDIPISRELIDKIKINGIKTITYTRERLKLKKDLSSNMISEKNLERAMSVVDDIEGALRNKSNKLPSNEINSVVDGFISDIRNNQDACLNLLDLVDFDDYTYTHSLNVSTLAIILGMSMNLEEEKVKILGVGGLLHDIGKSLVPIEIINKPGRLSLDEWNIVKNHSVYGYNILKAEKSFNNQVPNMILLHHENYNGTGYPLGLKADKINAFAQILMTVDVFDAITSKRCYKEAKPYSEAFTFIMENSGTKFHPKIAQTFLKDLVKKINGEPLYPQNCYVLLNTGEIAYVVNYRQSMFTLRPIINIFFNPNKPGKFLKFTQQIDLEQDYDRYVIKRITDEKYIIKFNKILNFEGI